MSESKIIFSLDGVDLTIQCTSDDKMGDICQKYVTQLGKNINSFLFLYGGIKINYALSFIEQANSLDRVNNKMRILVYQNINEKDININNNNLFENVKSIIILKKIFSYINQRVKFKAIKYNKRLQNKNNLNLIDYKFFSGKYIIYETRTKGKEYDSYYNSLIYEGEYLNGKRNGKGKEYSDGKLEFEGEYLNGEKIKGKEFFNEQLKFEGEYLYDKKWNGKGYDEYGILYELINGNGNVKEYDCYGKLIFEGEYLNGKKHGKGKEYSYEEDNSELKYDYININKYRKNKEVCYRKISLYEGEFLNGEKNGKGKEYCNGKLEFEGEYLNGEKNGKGKEYDWKSDLIFEGIYLNGYRWNGKGKEYGYYGKLEYEVEYINGKKTLK